MIGGSAGSIEALITVARELSPTLPAAVAVVVHRPPSAGDPLPSIISRAGPLRASRAQDGEQPLEGHIYICPGGVHLAVEGDRFHLDPGPRENGCRPAIDRLFRTAAASFGPRALAVVLSGGGHDGAVGAATIKASGGTVLVQDPKDATHPEMPSSTIGLDDPDEVLPTLKLAGRINEILGEYPTRPPAPMRPPSASQEEEAEGQSAPAFGCPACGGPLRPVEDGPHPHFVCHVGHRFTPEALAAAQDDAIEAALWTSVRLLKERAEVARRLAGRSGGAGSTSGRVRYFERRAAEADRHAETLRRLLGEEIAPIPD